MRAAGVAVEAFRPIRLSTLHLAQHRSHVRGIVIDGRIGWTGGLFTAARVRSHRLSTCPRMNQCRCRWR